MPVLTLLNVIAATLLMTALYTISRPLLDRAGNVSSLRGRPYPRRRKGRARERKTAMLSAAFGAGIIIMSNSMDGGSAQWVSLSTVPMALAGAVYWYRKG